MERDSLKEEVEKKDSMVKEAKKKVRLNHYF